MPMIYKRFTEKTAEEWRQIYKVGPTSYLGKAGKSNNGMKTGIATPRIPYQARLRTRCR